MIQIKSVTLTLKVVKFYVCSTGEEVIVPVDQYSLTDAKKLRDEKQANDSEETWSIIAVIDV